jgi:SAM-dependent methyltransferase
VADRPDPDQVSWRLGLQEDEYRLPHHWILRNHGLVNYLHKSDRLAALVTGAAVTGGAALDVGCGDGRGTHELAERLGPAFTWTGVDFSERAIAFARLMAPELEFEVQAAEALAFDDASFDLVVAREVIEHVPPDGVGAFVAELRRVLRPGGRLVVTTPTTNRRVPDKHFQHFTEASLRRALEGDGGFTVEVVEGLGWFPSRPGLERAYRYVIALPALWRLDAWCGTRALSPRRADDLLVLARAA